MEFLQYHRFHKTGVLTWDPEMGPQIEGGFKRRGAAPQTEFAGNQFQAQAAANDHEHIDEAAATRRGGACERQPHTAAEAHGAETEERVQVGDYVLRALPSTRKRDKKLLSLNNAERILRVKQVQFPNAKLEPLEGEPKLKFKPTVNLERIIKIPKVWMQLAQAKENA